MIDKLLQLLRNSQPWKVRIEPWAIEDVIADISTAFPDEQALARTLRHLDSFVDSLERAPLKVLGHPPLGTDKPQIFRYSADPQALLSVIADLDLERKELVVTQIKLKGASRARH